VLGVLILAACAFTLRAQPSSQPPGSTSKTNINGVVIDESDHRIPNARVALGSGGDSSVVLADGSGYFSLTALPGRHHLTIGKSGYAAADLEVTIPGEALVVRLKRGGVISGRVADEFGDPVPGARVSAESPDRGSVGASMAAAAYTDDLGEYRLGSLTPGSFTVSVLTMAAPVRRVVGSNVFMDLGPHHVYFPGVSSASEAERLRLEPGEERSRIDFVLPANAAGGQGFLFMPGPLDRPIQRDPDKPATGVIRSRVVGTDGRAIAHAQVRAFLEKDAVQAGSTRADSLARFEFAGLPAGKFRVVAAKVGYATLADDGSAALPPSRKAGVLIDLSTGETHDRVDVALARLGTISGRVFDEFGDPIQGANVALLRVEYEMGRRRLVPAEGIAPATDDLGRYRVYRLFPGRGRFAVDGLPMGGYYVSAVARLPNDGEDAWQDPAFLESLISQASTVTIVDGAKATVDLRVPTAK
jgi:Carboxypeptidase regulatory-like domain